MVTQRINKGFFDKLYIAMMKNARHVLLIIGLILFFISVACGYMLWMNEQNKAAQRYFGLLIMEYNQVKQEQDFDWQNLLTKFEKGFDKHSRSSLLPYYKDYAVNILLKQNKKNEALALLDSIILDTQASPLSSLYKMERAIMALDMPEADMKQLAEDSLMALADDQSNQFRDSALFYLGRYYWEKNNIPLARKTWQKLVDEQKDEKVAPSPWADQVKDYLSLIIV